MAKRTLRKPKKSKTSLAKKIQRSNRKKMSNSRSKRKTRSKRLRSRSRRMSDKALSRSRSKQKKSKRRGKILRKGGAPSIAASGARARQLQAERDFQTALDQRAASNLASSVAGSVAAVSDPGSFFSPPSVAEGPGLVGVPDAAAPPGSVAGSGFSAVHQDLLGAEAAQRMASADPVRGRVQAWMEAPDRTWRLPQPHKLLHSDLL